MYSRYRKEYKGMNVFKAGQELQRKEMYSIIGVDFVEVNHI